MNQDLYEAMREYVERRNDGLFDETFTRLSDLLHSSLSDIEFDEYKKRVIGDMRDHK